MNEILNPQISTHNTINLMKEVLRQVLSQRTYNESVAAETNFDIDEGFPYSEISTC